MHVAQVSMLFLAGFGSGWGCCTVWSHRRIRESIPQPEAIAYRVGDELIVETPVARAILPIREKVSA